MTPKEKARELVDKFMNIPPKKISDYSRIYLPTAKECARIAVDELIKYANTFGLEYWQEVKQEIDNL
jgi:hypothetical protein